MKHDENREKKMSRRDLVLATADDMMTDFLYYNRKEDEALEVGEIEKALKKKEVTIDEILAIVRKALEGAIR